MVELLIERYQKQTDLGHDDENNPAATVEMITTHLGDISLRLAGIDDDFSEAHQMASKLFVKTPAQ